MKKEPKQGSKRSPRFLLLMPEDIRYEIARSAASHGRTVTAEINIRLRDSLKPGQPHSYPPSATPGPAQAHEKSPGYTLTGIDQAMLSVFRALPPEKQLALLSLFK